MRELIWQSARLRLPRLLLLALGAALITAGLSYLLGTLQRSQTEVMEKMEDRWKVSYDILVRPANAPETESFLTPGQLTGAGGGISMAQWQAIREIPGVEVAAPVTQLGWVNYPVSVNVQAAGGLYRLSWEQSQSDGMQTYTAKGTDYTEISAQAGDYISLSLSVPLPVAVVAVSPRDEALLLGLDRAVTGGAYFGPAEDRPIPNTHQDGVVDSLPVLVSGATYANYSLTVKMERLDPPPGKLTQDLLAKLPGTPALTWQNQPGRLAEALLQRLDPTKIQTWWTARLEQAPLPPIYEGLPSPDAARWPDAFRAVPAGAGSWRFAGIREGSRPHIRFHAVGTYDPDRIQLPSDSDPSAPLYRMGTAERALGADGKPAAQPARLMPLPHPSAYLTSPPVLITTLGAAQSHLGGAPIGMIRVRVANVTEISPESIERIEKVAKAIAAATDLKVEVMRGASPEQVLVHLPGSAAEAGYYTQTWIRKGQAVGLFQELRRGDALVMGLVLLVGVVFVIASSVVHVMLRQRELSTLAAVGWRTRDLLVLTLAEAGMVAFAGAAAASLAFPRLQTLAAALGTLLLYTLGAALATLATGISRPMRLIQGGGITPYKRLAHVENLRQVSWGSLWARRRNLLSLTAIILPTALMVVLTALTVRLEDRLFVSVLGSQIAVAVGPLHYALMLAAFALAAATTADLMSLAVLERRTELALLGALGWPRKALRSLVLWEGALWGLTAGLAGTILGLGVLYVIYGRVHTGLWPMLPVILAVPTVTGLLGAIVPAESAARMEPARGVKAS